ncbi:M23 family metallopeptidase [Candidatus Curtissbacteria bacterium]|nr:M23 family metallopeptidase [Candidatus Curtissbacteria bacterium]
MSEVGTEEPSVKKSITEETKEWSPELDTALPVNESDIPGFKAWVNWNGFQLDRDTGRGHDGFDFAAYLTTDNRIVFGLPSDTPIRAIADGEVVQILSNELTGGEYGAQINIEHGKRNGGMFSAYVHIKPSIKHGAVVKKGDIIGTLHKDPGEEEGRLVHLHMMLTSAYGTRGTSIVGGGLRKRQDNPGIIDPEIYKYLATPQGSANFRVVEFPNVTPENANFRVIRVND